MISVILPVYNESESLRSVYRSLKRIMNTLSQPYEMIFIDDGSTDGSQAVLSEIGSEDARGRVIRFDRNYGQSSAMQAGFDHANGNIFVTLDVDLENGVQRSRNRRHYAQVPAGVSLSQWC